MGRNKYSQFENIPHVCYACGSNKTSKDHWYLNLDPSDKNHVLNMLCNTCMKVIVYGTYYRPIAAKNRHRDIKFKDRVVRYHFEPKTGRCSRCSNNIFDGSCKQTQIHHNAYDEKHPLDHTEELCAQCHWKETNKTKPPVPRGKDGKFIKHTLA